jgi:hypothetical protein
LLAANQERLLANLKALKGRWEMGLTFSFDKEQLARAAFEENDEIKALSARIDQSAPGAAHLLRRRLDSCCSMLVDSMIAEQMDRILCALHTVCSEVKAEPAGENSPDRNSYLWKTTCLLAQDRANAREALVTSLRQAFDNSIKLRVSGPWPPYSFAVWKTESMKQQREEEDALKV